MRTENLEEPETKKIPGLGPKEDLLRLQILVPEKWMSKIRKIAFDSKVSQGSLAREAIREWLEKQRKPAETLGQAKICDNDLSEILSHCTTFFGGFNIEGKSGFIASMKTSNLRLKDLNLEQWERVKKELSVGYSAYRDTPSLEVFSQKFRVLEPSDEQKLWLSTKVGEFAHDESEVEDDGYTGKHQSKEKTTKCLQRE